MNYFNHESIGKDLYRIILPGNVFAYLAVGSHSASLIDTGFGIGSLKEYIKTITDRPYVVLLTHGHYDHAGGAGEFDEVYIPKEDIPLARKSGIRYDRIRAMHDMDIREEDIIPDLREDQIRLLVPDQEFDLGGCTLKILPMRGHTPGMCCILFVESRTVLFGDACNSAAYMQLDESSCICEYLASLKEFKKKYGDLYDTVLYSHPHNFGGKEILDETITLCEDIIAGRDDSIHMGGMFGHPCFIAKAVSPDMKRVDGKTANILYRKSRIR